MKPKKPKLPTNVFMKDAQLEQTAGHLDSQGRINVAQNLERWAVQLRKSAFELDAKGITDIKRPRPLWLGQELN